MFSRAVDASKIALIALCRQLQQWGFGMLDCQVTNPHLLSMGAVEIPRNDFLARIEQLVQIPVQPTLWKDRFSVAVQW